MSDGQGSLFESTPEEEQPLNENDDFEESHNDSTKKTENGEEARPEDFHQAMNRLKELAESLERGELPLEEAMSRYREGLDLVDFCEERLEEAEMLIEEIEDDGTESPPKHEKEPPES
ncbi:MAG: exodeoxyribonuclease VII small subunit [bacterium]